MAGRGVRRLRVTAPLLGVALLASGCTTDPKAYAQSPAIAAKRAAATASAEATLAKFIPIGRVIGTSSEDWCDPGIQGPPWTSIYKFRCALSRTALVAPAQSTGPDAALALRDAFTRAGCDTPSGLETDPTKAQFQWGVGGPASARCGDVQINASWYVDPKQARRSNNSGEPPPPWFRHRVHTIRVHCPGSDHHRQTRDLVDRGQHRLRGREAMTHARNPPTPPTSEPTVGASTRLAALTVAVALLVSGCTTDPKVHVRSRDIVQQRAAATAAVEATIVTLAPIGRVLGRSSADWCEEGQDNWWWQDIVKLRCTVRRSALIAPAQPTGPAAAAALAQTVTGAGCSPLQGLVANPSTEGFIAGRGGTSSAQCGDVQLAVSWYVHPKEARRWNNITHEFAIELTPFESTAIDQITTTKPMTWWIDASIGYVVEKR